MSDLPLVVCDVETTGLSEDLHRVIEVAWAKIVGRDWHNFEIKTVRFELSPIDYQRGAPQAYAVNGYRRGHPDWQNAPLLDSPAARAAWREIKDAFEGTILVNQNVSFDAKFLMAEMSRHADRALDDPPWQNATWEVGAFSKLHMKRSGQRGWKLHPAYVAAGGPPLPEHRAESDVLRALWVMATGLEMWPETWPDIQIDHGAVKLAVETWAKHRLQTTV